MKKTTRLLALGACSSVALCSALPAHGQDTRFYVKGDLGGNVTQDASFKEFFGPVAPGSKVTFDPGFRAGIAGGYQATDWFAAEAELGYMANQINSISSATRIHDATYSNVPLLFNAKLQYPNQSPLTPYIGAGVGFSTAILNADFIEIGDVTLSGGSQATVVFAYQAFAGLSYKLNEQMDLSVEYRYFVADSPEWQADFTFGTFSDTMSFGRTQTHAVSLAFKFRF
jgi:opacity protein-like surface antigen